MATQDLQTKFRNWIFPTLLTITGWLMINQVGDLKSDINDLKTDIKTLLENSATDKADIANLKIEIHRLSDKVYGIYSVNQDGSSVPFPNPKSVRQPVLYTIPDDKKVVVRHPLQTFVSSN